MLMVEGACFSNHTCLSSEIATFLSVIRNDRYNHNVFSLFFFTYSRVISHPYGPGILNRFHEIFAGKHR